jgi:hypothetical protein
LGLIAETVQAKVRPNFGWRDDELQQRSAIALRAGRAYGHWASVEAMAAGALQPMASL